MHKTKKKTRSVKLPKPINIKKEKTEEERTLQPISHFIDDRLELVKQIFGTLKPKTITNLAPDFLKKKNMDEIEELCLNELICISTKRLLSIINATKCPTDTESSGDSDVQHEEEHISLEEISSDSEIDGTSSTSKKKTTETGSKAKKNTKESAKKEENNGQISVLELLELQARARAIRSQLALEPVTKIEVDSDEGRNSKASKTSKDRNEDHAERKRKSTEKERERTKSGTNHEAKQIKTNGSTEATVTTASTLNKGAESCRDKKYTHVRNYRNNNNNLQAIENNTKMQEKIMSNVEITVKILKEVKKERSASPDVIPIVAEPETLFVSDSSETEEKGKKKTTVKAFETTTKSKKNIQTDVKTNAAIVSTCNKAEFKKKETPKETEEGEITDTESEKANVTKTEKIKKKDPSTTTECTSVYSTKNYTKKAHGIKDTSKEVSLEVSKSGNSISKSGSVVEAKVAKAPDIVSNPSKVDGTQEDNDKRDVKSATNFQEDEDQNDDIISIGGGDLESEMIEHLEESSCKFATTAKASEDQKVENTEIILLNSSEDERDEKASESWHSRYLKSSKVSKVLAASRLSKRVRDKIKKSKTNKMDKTHETKEAELTKSSKEAFISKHEDGSVEQYRELLELRQRKT